MGSVQPQEGVGCPVLGNGCTQTARAVPATRLVESMCLSSSGKPPVGVKLPLLGEKPQRQEAGLPLAERLLRGFGTG